MSDERYCYQQQQEEERRRQEEDAEWFKNFRAAWEAWAKKETESNERNHA